MKQSYGTVQFTTVLVQTEPASKGDAGLSWSLPSPPCSPKLTPEMENRKTEAPSYTKVACQLKNVAKSLSSGCSLFKIEVFKQQLREPLAHALCELQAHEMYTKYNSVYNLCIVGISYKLNNL